jgi:Rrf2 family cysteine metabolism transcriptional repressor
MKGLKMLVSQKDRYALRAVFELARRHGRGPVKVAEIAAAQSIPPRFLEVILNELKQTGFVASRRGKHGGYFLLAEPDELTVGDVMGFLEGPVEVTADNGGNGDSVLGPVWHKIQDAISGVYQTTTFADLVEQEQLKMGMRVPTYAI